MEAVERFRVLAAPADPVFERVARLAAWSLKAPMAVVSIVDSDRIWFAGAFGLDAGLRYVPRDQGLCMALIDGGVDHVMVEDASTDPRRADNQLVHDYRIRFYAGAPIVDLDGHRLGAVVVMDTEARAASGEELAVLDDFAALVIEQLGLRLSVVDSPRVERRLRVAAEFARDDARSDRDAARRDLDAARQARDDARLDGLEARQDRDLARSDRDDAVRDRDIVERERDLVEAYAAVLQKTLLPPSLPIIDGLTLAASYHPASSRRVGGDFYDVFGLGENRWAFFIGDVEGHGADAAVVTSLIRYTLRSAALHYRDPVQALVELNSVLLREAVPRRMCTVLLGTIEPSGDRDGFWVTIATGGHPPAMLVNHASGRVDLVRSSGGMLVGVIPDATFDACSVRLRPGQTLLFYTDGIVEARRGTNPFDEDSLAAFVAERSALAPGALIDELAALIPKLDPDDDVAVLSIGADRHGT